MQDLANYLRFDDMQADLTSILQELNVWEEPEPELDDAADELGGGGGGGGGGYWSGGGGFGGFRGFGAPAELDPDFGEPASARGFGLLPSAAFAFSPAPQPPRTQPPVLLFGPEPAAVPASAPAADIVAAEFPVAGAGAMVPEEEEDGPVAEIDLGGSDGEAK